MKIGSDEFSVKFSFFGREDYYLNGQLIRSLRTLRTSGRRKFEINGRELVIDLSSKMTDFHCKAFLDGELFVEEMFPEFKARHEQGVIWPFPIKRTASPSRLSVWSIKILSVLLCIFNVFIVLGLSASLYFGQNTQYLGSIAFMGFFLSINAICIWCWVKKYLAPWYLLIGFTFLSLSIISTGLYIEGFSELDTTKKIVCLLCYLGFGYFGAVSIYYSRVIDIAGRKQEESCRLTP